jgi:hypothetical protein
VLTSRSATGQRYKYDSAAANYSQSMKEVGG